MKCPYCSKQGRADQIRYHTRMHRQIKEQRRDLLENLDRLERMEFEAR